MNYIDLPRNQQLDRDLRNPRATHDSHLPFRASELDLFEIKQRALQSVVDLVTPIVEQIDGERAERAKIEVRNDQLEKRLIFIEGLLQVSNPYGGPEPKKPACIEHLETRFADFKSDFTKTSSHLDGRCNHN